MTSHSRAAKATASGRFREEIVSCATEITNPKTGVVVKVVVDKDDGWIYALSDHFLEFNFFSLGIRETNLEVLSKLKTVFSKGGTTTAGNSSQVSDGAAATLLMSRATAKKLGLKILGSLRRYSLFCINFDYKF